MIVYKEYIKATLLKNLPNSNIHGINHLDQTISKKQKIFWLSLFIIGLICCVMHVTHLINESKKSPVSSSLLFYENEFKFPDITFCYLKPVSEPMYALYKSDLINYNDKEWNSFEIFETIHKEIQKFMDKIIKKYSKIQIQDINVEAMYALYKSDLINYTEEWDFLKIVETLIHKNIQKYIDNIIKKISKIQIQGINVKNLMNIFLEKNKISEDNLFFKEFSRTIMEIFWVSDAAREFSHSDNVLSSIHCKYNGEKCNKKDFKLVQTSEFWNCYTYVPPKRTLSKSDNAALEIIAFTDTSSSTKKEETYTRNEMRNIETYFLKTSLNQIWNNPYSGASGEGLRIFIHNPDEYPLHSSQYFDLPSGVHATIQISQTDYEKIDTENNPCQKESKNVTYVRAFEKNKNSVINETYRLTPKAAVIRHLQDFVYKIIGCYSHLMPFDYKHFKNLCYYIPPEERSIGWYSWIDGTVKPGTVKTYFKILKHYFIYKLLENNTVVETILAEKPKTYETCKTSRYNAGMSHSLWPKTQDIQELVNLILIPGLIKSNRDTNRYEIIKKQKKGIPLQNDAVLKYVFNQSKYCGNKHNVKENKKKYLRDYWCTTTDTIRDNFAYITIKPDYPAAHKYEEHKKSWSEYLGELGGTLGLWLGISLLSIVEIIELAYLCIFEKPKTNVNKNEEENVHVQLQPLPLEPLEIQLLVNPENT